MSFLKRKQPNDTAPSTTPTTTSTIIAHPISRFQRRGARQAPGQPPPQKIPSLADTTTTNTTNTNTTTTTTATTTIPVSHINNNDNITPNDDDTNTPNANNTQNLTETPQIDPETHAKILQLQQDRLDELLAARESRYSEDRPPSGFQSVQKWEIWAIKRYLWLWERDLSSRSLDETQGFYGKQDLADYNEARTDIRPLIKQINENKVKNEILLCVANILDALSKRDYIQAQQAFLDVAIGNNPWPIGLPKVGIHERRAREKIDPSLVDHILKDPTIQAYMRALKRLIAWVEKKFPPE